MEESPASLKRLANLEAHANEAYSCYLGVTKSSTKMADTGMAMCKASQATVTALRAPLFTAGGREVDDICSALEGTVGLLRSLYSKTARKPTLSEVHDLMAQKRRGADAALRKHHDALQRACTMKQGDEKCGAADADVAAREAESGASRLEWRQALEHGMLRIQQEHASVLASTLFNQLSAHKAAHVKLEAMLPVLSALQDRLAAEEGELKKRHSAEKEAGRASVGDGATRGEEVELARGSAGERAIKEGFIFKQHGTGLWGRCWTVVDRDSVKWWAAKGAGGGIDWTAPKRTLPLQLCTVKEPPFEKDVRCDRSRFVFALVSAENGGGGSKPKLFQAHSEADMLAWTVRPHVRDRRWIGESGAAGSEVLPMWYLGRAAHAGREGGMGGGTCTCTCACTCDMCMYGGRVGQPRPWVGRACGDYAAPLQLGSRVLCTLRMRCALGSCRRSSLAARRRSRDAPPRPRPRARTARRSSTGGRQPRRLRPRSPSPTSSSRLPRRGRARATNSAPTVARRGPCGAR